MARRFTVVPGAAVFAFSRRRTVCKARFDVIPGGLFSSNRPSTASYRLFAPRAIRVTPPYRISAHPL